MESDLAKSILLDVVQTLKIVTGTSLVQGDFNINSSRVGEYFAGLFDEQFDEITLDDATTPKGRKYDHILFRGLKLREMNIDSTVLTDHFPVTAIFEL